MKQSVIILIRNVSNYSRFSYIQKVIKKLNNTIKYQRTSLQKPIDHLLFLQFFSEMDCYRLVRGSKFCPNFICFFLLRTVIILLWKRKKNPMEKVVKRGTNLFKFVGYHCKSFVQALVGSSQSYNPLNALPI